MPSGVVHTGVPSLDPYLPGWPTGQVSELVGEPGSGKSLLAQHAARATQRSGQQALWIDADATLTPVPNLWVVRPAPLTQTLTLVHQLLRDLPMRLLVVDPLPALCRSNSSETPTVAMALRALHNLARRHQLAVLALNHPIAGDRISPMPRSSRPWGLRCPVRVGLEPIAGAPPDNPARTVWIRQARRTEACHLDLTELSEDRIGNGPNASIHPRVLKTQATRQLADTPSIHSWRSL